MIVKFLPSKSGGGIGSVNYVLNERVQQGTAKILKGDEAQTRAIISQITKKQKVCFGVLSFQESAARISEQTKLEIMADFERTLLGDFMKERINILWVQHEDKGGRLELNFIIPKIDLVTGTSFNPFFYSKPDLTRIDLWKKAVNLEYGFSDPDDPGRKNTISASKKDIKNYANVEALDKTLHELVETGIIKSRAQMLELLRNENIQISRETKNSITVILPGSTKKNRLQGGIYADFKDARELEEQSEEYVNIITEIFNQKFNNTETKLTNLYQSEMNTISENLNSKLESIEQKADSTFRKIEHSAKQTNAYKWTTLALTAILFALIGAGSGIWITWNKINPATQWQIPQEMRYVERTKSKKATNYFLEIPKEKVQTDGNMAYIHIKTIED